MEAAYPQTQSKVLNYATLLIYFSVLNLKLLYIIKPKEHAHLRGTALEVVKRI